MQATKADIRRAAYLTVHEFPPTAGLSAVESAALVIGRAPGTTYNKVDPASEQGLYLTEALQLMLAHGDHRILHALAAACDHVAVPLADLRAMSDTALLDLFILAIEASSARSSVIRKALGDGRIDPVELGQIQSAFYDELRALLELRSRLEAICVDRPR